MQPKIDSNVTKVIKIKAEKEEHFEIVLESSKVKIEPKVQNSLDTKNEIEDQWINKLKTILHNDLKQSKNESLKKGCEICKFCGKKSSTKAQLKEHMKKVHPTEVKFKSCEICNEGKASRWTTSTI